MTTPTGPGYGSGGPGGTSGQGGERDGAPEREGVPVSGAPQVGAPGGTPGGAGASPLPPPSATPAMPPATPPATPPTAPRPAAPAAPSAAPGGDPRPATPREGFGGNAAAGGAGLGAGAAATAARPSGGPGGGPGGTGGPTGPGTSGGAGGPSGSTTFGTLPGGSTPLRTGKPRRARLVVRRIDPWSVLKFTLLFSLCLLIVFVVAVAALYYALDSMGVFTEVNDFVRELTQASSGGRRTGGVEVPFTATRVIGVAAVIGLINVVLITAISTLGAFLYNLCADIVGGIEITLAERE